MKPQLDVGETLQEVFETYRDQAGVLLPVAFWLYLAVAIVNELVGDDIALFLVPLVLSTLAGTLYQGMVVGVVRDLRDGRRDASFGNLVRSVLPVLGPLVGAGILAGLGIGVGFVLLLFPGLFLLTIWAVIAPAIVVERRGAIEAFGRSRELVQRSGQGWRVFGAIVVAFLIAAVVGVVFVLVASAIADGPILRIVFSALASTLTAPVEGLVAAVLYFRLLPLQSSPAADSVLQ